MRPVTPVRSAERNSGRCHGHGLQPLGAGMSPDRRGQTGPGCPNACPDGPRQEERRAVLRTGCGRRRHTSDMTETTAPVVELPRQRGAVTVRVGGLHEDLDALHEGDPLWWGKDFVADRVRSMPPGTPHLMLIGELDGEPVADAFHIGKGAARTATRSPASTSCRTPVAEVWARDQRPAGRGERRPRPPRYGGQRARAGRGKHGGGPRLGYEVMGHHRESLLDLDTLDVAAGGGLGGAGGACRVRAAAVARRRRTSRTGASSTT